MDTRIGELKNSYTEGNKEFYILLDKLKESLRINIYDLEKDCANHSELYFKAAIFVSTVGLLQNRSELLVKELKAEIATDIRSNPDKYGITKLTEGQVLEGVDSAEYAKEARTIRALCMRLKNDADALLQAFEHRRSMLNNEVQLYLSKLSEPKAQVQRGFVEKTIVDAKKARRLNE